MVCIHEMSVQEYGAITEQYEDLDTFVYFDGPVVGTARCRSCGQVFLYVRSEETESTRLWRYYPIDAETAAKLVAEELDADEYTDRVKPEAHMRVVETFFRAAPCKVEWVGRLTTD